MSTQWPRPLHIVSSIAIRLDSSGRATLRPFPVFSAVKLKAPTGVEPATYAFTNAAYEFIFCID
jgi:hypothetical protein